MREPWDLAQQFIQGLQQQTAASRNTADTALMRMMGANIDRQNAGTAQGYSMDTLAKRNDYSTQADTTAFDRQLQRDETAYGREDKRFNQQREFQLADKSSAVAANREQAILEQQLLSEREAARGEYPGSVRRHVPQSAGNGKSLAVDTIKQFEGFRNTPYWDVNADRVGYGSDTITNPDGSVQRVTKGTRVSREDADRDLARRTDQFAEGARKQVGPKWDTLADNQKAALTSMAYNYGALPRSVVNAVISADPNDDAMAISARGRDNGGVNAKRRNKEAQLYNGTGEQRRYTDADTGNEAQGNAVSSSILGLPVANGASKIGLEDVGIPTHIQSYIDSKGLEVKEIVTATEAAVAMLPDKLKENYLPLFNPATSDNKRIPQKYIIVEPRLNADGAGKEIKNIPSLAEQAPKGASLKFSNGDSIELDLPD